MTLSDIFQDSGIRQQLVVFSEAEKDAVEQALFDKGGKPYIKCFVRGKEVHAKKEEVIRQLWLKRLQDHYGYASGRLTVEYPITFGRDSSKRSACWARPLWPAPLPACIIRPWRGQALPLVVSAW
jgi:type I restriction enzyme M protein